MMKKIFATLLLAMTIMSLNAQSITPDTVKTQTPPQQQPVPAAVSTPPSTSTSNQPAEQGGGKKFDPRRLVVGGTFGFGYTSDYFSLNISPQIGYQFSKYITAGAGIGYSYYSSSYANYSSSLNYLGFNVYGRLSPIRAVFLQAQPEIYGMWGSQGGKSVDSQVVPCVLLGGGVVIPMGRNGGMTAMILYDVVQDDWSPYGSQAVYSIGYVFNF